MRSLGEAGGRRWLSLKCHYSRGEHSRYSWHEGISLSIVALPPGRVWVWDRADAGRSAGWALSLLSFIVIYTTLPAYSLHSVQGETEPKRGRKTSNGPMNCSQGALSNRSHGSPTLSPFCSKPGYHQTSEEGLFSSGTLP